MMEGGNTTSKQAKIIISEDQKEIISELGHGLYTIDFLEDFLNRAVSTERNTAEALQAMVVHGFYEAVRCLDRNKNRNNPA